MNRGPLNQTISFVVGRAKRQMGEPVAATKWCGNDERVFRRCSDVNTALQELRHVLHLIRHADELADLRMLLKLHTVAWSSLADVLAGVINEVFDLGYAERQVDLGALLQNRHVKAAGVPDIVKRHSKAVESKRFSILRNDVVHRARLDDPELELLEKAEFEIMLAAAFDAPPGDRDKLRRAIASAVITSGVTAKVSAFACARAEYLAEHLSRTEALIAELDATLAQILSGNSSAA
jgi:hypothetical protein